MKLKDTVTINRPIEEVFNAWTDVEKYPEWADPVVQRKKLTEGPVGVGSKFNCIDQWPGRKVEFEMEITEYEKNKRFGARWFKPMEGNWTSKLIEDNDGTTLLFEIEMRLPFLMRLLTPIMKKYAKNENRKFMISFKSRLEGE